MFVYLGAAGALTVPASSIGQDPSSCFEQSTLAAAQHCCLRPRRTGLQWLYSSILDLGLRFRYAVYIGSATRGVYSLHRRFVAAGKKASLYTLFTGVNSSVPQDVVVIKTTEACGTNTGCDWGSFGTVSFHGLEIDDGA